MTKSVTNRRKKRCRKWHKWLGVALFIPLIFFTVTGLLLNHSADLELEKKKVRSEWVMERYGLSFDKIPTCHRLSNGVIVTSWQGQVLLGDKLIIPGDHIAGACLLENGICIATNEQVHYLSTKGELIETLNELVLPQGTVEQIGISKNGSLVIQVKGEFWGLDSDLIEASPITDVSDVKWSTSSEPTQEEIEAFKAAIIGTGMPLDRVVLDIHSGKLFGSFGKILVDIFGFGILMMSLTGIILFIRSLRKKRSSVKGEAS